MKYEKDQQAVSKISCAVNEEPVIEKKEEIIEQVFICDECGDTLWDKVLEQDN